MTENGASDVFGVSGMLMLKALLAGNATAEQMAQLAKGQMKKKVGELTRALEGRVEEHHRYLLGRQMKRLEEIGGDIDQLEQHIEQKLEPYRREHELLMQIPGVDWGVAAVMVAEMGVTYAQGYAVGKPRPEFAGYHGRIPNPSISAAA